MRRPSIRDTATAALPARPGWTAKAGQAAKGRDKAQGIAPVKDEDGMGIEPSWFYVSLQPPDGRRADLEKTWCKPSISSRGARAASGARKAQSR